MILANLFMTSLDIIFQSAAVLLALLAIYILLWVNRDISHSKRVLILLLTVATLMNINGLLFHSGWYLTYPQFHKMLYPFALLIAPLSYIYALFRLFRFRGRAVTHIRRLNF